MTSVRARDALIAAVRARHDPEALERLAHHAASIDWERVRALAALHAVTPLVAAALAGLPEAAALALDADAARARSLELAGELLRLLDAFAEAWVEVLPYKGPVLSAAVYGDPALRTFVDLDFLVRRPDLPGALAVLRERGFEDRRPLTPRQQRHLLKTGHDRKMIGGRTVVELQWAISDGITGVPVPLEPLFARRTTVRVGGREVPSLEPEDLLPVLCIHGSLHLWERLAWVADVAETLRAFPNLDAAESLRRADAWRARTMLLVGVAMAERVLGAPVPPALRPDARARALARRLAGMALARGDGGPDEPNVRTHLRLALALRDTGRDRVGQALRTALVPSVSDWITTPLPDALWPAYYVLRPLRLVGSYVLGRRLPGDVERG